MYAQLLGQPVEAAFHTDDYSPSLAVPEGFNILPPDTPGVLGIQTINLPGDRYYAAYHVYKPTELVNRDVLAGSWNDSWDALLGVPATWRSYGVRGAVNETVHVDLPAQNIIGARYGVFAYGVGAKILDYEDRMQHLNNPHALYGALELTNLGIFAQWMPDGGFVSVHHLTDGSPAANASIEIYPLGRPTPCTTALTGVDGVAMMGPDQLGGCVDEGRTFKTAPKMLIIVREGQDWAFVRMDGSDYTNTPPQFGWWDGYPRSALFTDRQLYQPGETVNFTGVVYYLAGGALIPAAGRDFKLVLSAPDQTTTDLGVFHADRLGTFSSTIHLKANQQIGYYQIRTADWNIRGEFEVQEFKPPNFSVDLKVNHPIALAGQRVDATSTTSYLFGTPVVNATARFLLDRELTYFAPPGRDEYWFGPSYIDRIRLRRFPNLRNPRPLRTDIAGHTKTSFS